MEKVQAKLRNLKTNAFVVATLCNHIDVLSAPSRDPRINHKLKKKLAHQMVYEVLNYFFNELQTQFEGDPNGFKKYLLKPSITDNCLIKLKEFAKSHNLESR